MIALGPQPHTKGGPILGRSYAKPRRPLMTKVKALWEGLTSDRTSGSYIRPHLGGGGYEYGRWWHNAWGGYRFEREGDAVSMEAARAGLEAVDKAVERKAAQLNKRSKRRG